MFNDPFECYQEISEELIKAIDKKWSQIEVNCTLLSETRLRAQVTFQDENIETIGVWDSGKVPEYFLELATLVSTKEKGLYKTCNFILKPNGQFDVNFTYDD